MANGSGRDLSFTFFRPPQMTDEQFKAGKAWVERDLKALKRLLEGCDDWRQFLSEGAALETPARPETPNDHVRFGEGTYTR